jgi:Family of unknown function (DUF6464)
VLIALIIILGLAPPVLSLWILRQANQRTAQQLRATMRRSAERRFAPGLPSEIAAHGQLPADYRYVEGLGYMIGDLSCQFNARSKYLRCAVNPMGDCKTCSQYQARD